jgi:hypothetical protein
MKLRLSINLLPRLSCVAVCSHCAGTSQTLLHTLVGLARILDTAGDGRIAGRSINRNRNSLGLCTIEIAGNLSTVADTSKIPINRVVEHVALGTLEFPCVETTTLSAFFQSFPVSKSRLSEWQLRQFLSLPVEGGMRIRDSFRMRRHCLRAATSAIMRHRQLSGNRVHTMVASRCARLVFSKTGGELARE